MVYGPCPLLWLSGLPGSWTTERFARDGVSGWGVKRAVFGTRASEQNVAGSSPVLRSRNSSQEWANRQVVYLAVLPFGHQFSDIPRGIGPVHEAGTRTPSGGAGK